MLSIVIFDRFLMGFALAVHIIIASIGIALPVIILVAEFIGIRYHDPYYKVLAKRLAVVFVILFAVGTASGTVVALNLLFLWPQFMVVVGQVAILPLYAEVFAFFLESIFVGIYFYSWDRFSNGYLHLLTGIPVAVGASLSAVFITLINSFMNTPVGFNISKYLSTGAVTGVNPYAVFSSPASFLEVPHVLSTSFFAASFIFVAFFSYRLLRAQTPREKRYNKGGLKISIGLSAVSVLFAVITGILSIENLAAIQPEKYAAIEGDLVPMSHAPELIGGIPVGAHSLGYYLSIPNLQSILLTGSPSGVVPGLSSYPVSTWPPLIIHFMFDFMFAVGVLLGIYLAATLAIELLRKAKVRRSVLGISIEKGSSESRTLLKLNVLAAALAVILLEVGWMVDELGRQPWIIYNVMTVSQAANASPSVLPITILIVLFYALIIPFTILVLRRVFSTRPLDKEVHE
ncbi:MAG: cytochrome ubiquinol oxidase subunit I [Nitrososphaerota archaeon]|nr:cytochrome ubiquinol oxidase subunit I [Nitrososphaerota archaeon]